MRVIRGGGVELLLRVCIALQAVEEGDAMKADKRRKKRQQQAEEDRMFAGDDEVEYEAPKSGKCMSLIVSDCVCNTRVVYALVSL